MCCEWGVLQSLRHIWGSQWASNRDPWWRHLQSAPRQYQGWYCPQKNRLWSHTHFNLLKHTINFSDICIYTFQTEWSLPVSTVIEDVYPQNLWLSSQNIYLHFCAGHAICIVCVLVVCLLIHTKQYTTNAHHQQIIVTGPSYKSSTERLTAFW